MEQAILELVSNALDAMPRGGRLRIAAHTLNGANAPQEVAIEVSDTGGGIPEQLLNTVCEPFFTTREEGTGLGLAIAKRYVEQNGGRLEIESRTGAGTTVRVRLPADGGGSVSGTILVVDDERTLARAVKAFLQESGYEAEVAGNAEEALGLLETLRPDVVFSDVRLPGMDGIELLRRIRDFDPAIPVVIMTAYGTIEGAVQAVKLGAFDYLKKPVDLEELKLLADRARETSQLKQELSYYRRRAATEIPFSEVIGQSPAIRSVLDQARQIAALDETPPVLITGETGTGKGLVARTIHSSGPRSAKPFIEVNCTAIPATLMEAELFGHERGAFTDAKESKMGLFEAAEGGFLFLDEVGDVEMSLQGKLLKAVEDRTVRRVGGIRDRRINVRILAATNRDLEREAAREHFRRDLYFRLAVILLRLPSLRERGEDILLLADRLPVPLRGQVRQGRLENRRPRPGPAARLPLAREREGAEPCDRAGGPVEPRSDARCRAPRAQHADAIPGRSAVSSRRRWRPDRSAARHGPGTVGALAHRAGDAGGGRQPDPCGAAARHLPRYAALSAQEVRHLGDMTQMGDITQGRGPNPAAARTIAAHANDFTIH